MLVLHHDIPNAKLEMIELIKSRCFFPLSDNPYKILPASKKTIEKRILMTIMSTLDRYITPKVGKNLFTLFFRRKIRTRPTK